MITPFGASGNRRIDISYFIPEDFHLEEDEAIYFEDASGTAGIVGYSTQKSISELQDNVSSAFAKLGGYVHRFIRGKSGDRYGFRILSTFRGVAGQLDVIALPLRRETPARKQ